MRRQMNVNLGLYLRKKDTFLENSKDLRMGQTLSFLHDNQKQAATAMVVYINKYFCATIVKVLKSDWIFCKE